MNKEKEQAKCNLLFLIFNYFKEFAQAYKLKHGYGIKFCNFSLKRTQSLSNRYTNFSELGIWVWCFFFFIFFFFQIFLFSFNSEFMKKKCKMASFQEF